MARMVEADYLDGPALVRWLHEQPELRRRQLKGTRESERMRKWAQPGARVSIYAADKLLCSFGLALLELPAELAAGD
jgi:hypothetical protein